MVDKKFSTYSSEAKRNENVQRLSQSEDRELEIDEQAIVEAEDNTDAMALLNRIRRDRIDVELRLSGVRAYIDRTSSAMTRLKDNQEMAGQYRRLTAARADLVRNAVSLQQLHERLLCSEHRAGQLVSENVQPTPQADSSAEISAELSAVNSLNSDQPTTASQDESGADNLARAYQLEKQRLLAEIQHSEDSTRLLETRRRELEQVKNNLETKIRETTASRISLERRADKLTQEENMKPVEATNETCTTTESHGESMGIVSSLHQRFAKLNAISSDDIGSEGANELRQKLSQLRTFRNQMDEIIEQIESMKAARLNAVSEANSVSSPPNTEPARTEQTAPQAQSTNTDAEPLKKEPVTSSAADPHAGNQEPEPDTDQQRRQQLQADKHQLSHMLQLSNQLQLCADNGQQLNTAAPEQLAQLLAHSTEPPAAHLPDNRLRDAQNIVQSLQQVQQVVETVSRSSDPQ